VHVLLAGFKVWNAIEISIQTDNTPPSSPLDMQRCFRQYLLYTVGMRGSYGEFQIDVNFDYVELDEKQQEILKRLTQRGTVSDWPLCSDKLLSVSGSAGAFLDACRQASPPNIGVWEFW